MIFFKRNRSIVHTSRKETCLSLIGLLVIIGLIGGLAGLIYGLVKDHSHATVISAIVLGISIVLAVVFVAFIRFYFNTTTMNSHSTEQKNRQNSHKTQNNSLKEMRTTATGQDQQKNDSNVSISLPSMSIEFVNDKHHGCVVNKTRPSPKSSTSMNLNESHSSLNYNNSHQSHYDRH